MSKCSHGREFDSVSNASTSHFKRQICTQITLKITILKVSFFFLLRNIPSIGNLESKSDESTLIEPSQNQLSKMFFFLTTIEKWKQLPSNGNCNQPVTGVSCSPITYLNSKLRNSLYFLGFQFFRFAPKT